MLFLFSLSTYCPRTQTLSLFGFDTKSLSWFGDIIYEPGTSVYDHYYALHSDTKPNGLEHAAKCQQLHAELKQFLE